MLEIIFTTVQNQFAVSIYLAHLINPQTQQAQGVDRMLAYGEVTDISNIKPKLD